LDDPALDRRKGSRELGGEKKCEKVLRGEIIQGTQNYGSSVPKKGPQADAEEERISAKHQGQEEKGD